MLRVFYVLWDAAGAQPVEETGSRIVDTVGKVGVTLRELRVEHRARTLPPPLACPR